MFIAGQVWLRSISRLATALALALCAHSNSYAQSATAPTSSETPERIDEVWQKASSKYDAQRAELLKDVENADREGPYRADWESLKTTKRRSGTRTPSSEFSSTGECIRFPLSAANGIRGMMYRRGLRRIQASHRDLRYAGQIRLQGLNSHVQGRAIRSGGLGGVIQESGREIRGARGRASRRLRHVRQRVQRLDGGQNGAASRY